MTRSRNRARRPLLAMVATIQTDLEIRPEPIAERPLSLCGLSRLRRLNRRIEIAKRRGWDLAAQRLSHDRFVTASDLRLHISNWLNHRPTWRNISRSPNLGNLYGELLALEAEFGQLDCDSKNHELFVTTETIVLEGVELGRFEIRLDWRACAAKEELPYRVVALDPNPAAGSPYVTHPNVQHEKLCPGEGYGAIVRALAQWRLYEFFLVVHQILQTYSHQSPFVALEDWGQVPCSDCGSLRGEDGYSCQGCDTSLCSNCVTFCNGCDGDFCSQCAKTCSHCDDYYCSGCLCTCGQCQAAVCSGCREHDTLCKKCHEQNQLDEDRGPEERPPRRRQRSRPAPAGAAV